MNIKTSHDRASHCSADPACIFPVIAGGLCRHHERFFAYSESLTDSSLDCRDYLQDKDRGRFPLLSVVYRSDLQGEPRCREIRPLPPSTAPRGPQKQESLLALVAEEHKDHPDLTAYGIAQLIAKKHGVKMSDGTAYRYFAAVGGQVQVRDRGGRSCLAMIPDLESSLLRMPAKNAEALRLCFCERLSYRAAAQRLGIPEPTVQSRVRRGLQLSSALRLQREAVAA